MHKYICEKCSKEFLTRKKGKGFVQKVVQIHTIQL